MIPEGRNSWTTCSVSCRSGVSPVIVSVISNCKYPYLDLTAAEGRLWRLSKYFNVLYRRCLLFRFFAYKWFANVTLSYHPTHFQMYFGMILSEENQNWIFVNTGLINLIILIGLLDLNHNLHSKYFSFYCGCI